MTESSASVLQKDANGLLQGIQINGVMNVGITGGPAGKLEETCFVIGER
jgi:hypothetical protein